MVIPFSATFFLEVILQVSLKVVTKGSFKGFWGYFSKAERVEIVQNNYNPAQNVWDKL